MSPGGYGGYDGSYGSDGGGDYEEYERMEESPVMPSPSPTMASSDDSYEMESSRSAPKRKMSRERASKADYKDAGPSGGAAPASPAQPPPPPPQDPSGNTGSKQEGQPPPTEPTDVDADPAAGHDRLIIYMANMVISVFNVQETTKRVELLPSIVGGYVQSRREGYVVLKVPAGRLGEAMDLLSTYGVVLSRELAADDVTAEFVDLESRIRVLRDMQAHLLYLLKRARTVDEALHVRAALDRVTMELELALGRIRVLSNLIEFSTLTVQLQEQGPAVGPPSNDPFPWVDSLGVEATEFN